MMKKITPYAGFLLSVASLSYGADGLFSIFPAADAPSFLQVPSELVYNSKYQPWASVSHWSDEVDEKDVFHAELQHQSIGERSWVIKIGKGGQLYSIVSSWGETVPPQSAKSPWNDDVWQATVLNTKILDQDKALKGRANAFIHQSGMYGKNHEGLEGLEGKPFYSPMLASGFNEKERSYSTLCWGLIPTPSVNRGETLIYSKYRDLGAGVLEITYTFYNFGDYTLNDLTFPWGGVRTSVFPEQVVADQKGGYRFFTPFNYGIEGCHIDIKDTGGWIARVQNAADPAGYALGIVFGKDRHWDEQSQLKKAGKPFYQNLPTVCGSGDSRHGKRDYSVLAVAPRILVHPGEAFFMRVYMVLGTLEEVAAKSVQLVDHVEYGFLDYDENNAPLLPLYEDRKTGLSTQPPTDKTEPVAYSYAVPVKGSVPLFQLKETATGKVVLSTDPYALCGKKPFANPYSKGDPKYETYQNRVIYQPYDGKTEWLGLLGYVMPEKLAAKKSSCRSLSGVLNDSRNFMPGDRLDANELLLRTEK